MDSREFYLKEQVELRSMEFFDGFDYWTMSQQKEFIFDHVMGYVYRNYRSLFDTVYDDVNSSISLQNPQTKEAVETAVEWYFTEQVEGEMEGADKISLDDFCERRSRWL